MREDRPDAEDEYDHNHLFYRDRCIALLLPCVHVALSLCQIYFWGTSIKKNKH